MLSHSKLILFLLIVILTVMICIYHPFSKKKVDSNQENFESYITEIQAKRYNVNDIIDPDNPKVVVDEACAPGLAHTNLDILKNKMIYAKFCYQTQSHNENDKNTKFVNNFYQGETNNISQKPVEDNHNKVIRSHSDYLGCYQLYDGNDKSITSVDPKDPTIGIDSDELQFDTLEKIKEKYYKSSKVFMSGEIRDDLESKGLFDEKNIPKSLGGPLSDTQFKKLTDYSGGNNLRIPDKYCLGRVRMEHDRVKEYLGGVNAIAVYGNNTNVEDEERKPPIFIRDRLIVNDRPCMDNLNMECIINFNKHVVCDYNMIGNFWADVSNFDSQEKKKKITTTSIQEQDTSSIRNFYRTWTVEGFKENFIKDLMDENFNPNTYVDETLGINRRGFPGFQANVIDDSKSQSSWSDIVTYLKDLVINKTADKKNIETELERELDKLVTIEKESSDIPYRNIILDRSGNNNHMMLDYNYLHFVGTFDLRSNFDNISDYNDWLTTSTDFTESTTDNKLNNLTDENIIISRYKSKDEINKAKYMVKKYNSEVDELNKDKLNFCENHPNTISGIKNDSMVMRGLSKEWPYLGMIGWYNDKTKYKISGSGKNVSKYNVQEDTAIDTPAWCDMNAKFPNARIENNDTLIGRKGIRGRSRTLAFAKDSTSGGHHNCTCTGTDGLYRCDHMICFNSSFFKDIHMNENPNPLYVSVSINNTRNILQFYKNDTENLQLWSKPKLTADDEKQSNKFYYKIDATTSSSATGFINSNKFFMRTSNNIKNVFQDQFMCVFSYNTKFKIMTTAKDNIFSITNQEKKIRHTNTNPDGDKYSGIVGNPMLSYSSNFRSIYDKNEIKPDSNQYNQAFMWSYMRNYKKSKSSKPQDGLVYVKPQKVKSIVFLANGGRLSLGKITIYDLNGDIINFKILKYDTTFSLVEDNVLTNYEKQNNNESSYLFTINPIKLMIGIQVKYRKTVNGKRIYKTDPRQILSNYSFATNNPALQSKTSSRVAERGGNPILQASSVNVKDGFLISPYSETSSSQRDGGNIGSSSSVWIGNQTNFNVLPNAGGTSDQLVIEVKNVKPNHGFRYHPKLEIPATKNDFYMLKLSNSHYISRIVVESGIQDIQTTQIEKEQYFFDTTTNYYLEDNFEKVTMELYDEADTNKILAGTDDTNIQQISQNIYDIKHTINPINSIDFRSNIIHHLNSQDWEAGSKNSVIDFYNVGFIPDPNQDSEDSTQAGDKNVAIICQKNSDSEKTTANIYQLYLKSSVNDNLVNKSSTVEIPQDYLDSITSNNYNVKVGNLFFNHNQLEMTRLTIFRKSFFEDLQDIIEAEDYKVNDDVSISIDKKYQKQSSNKKLKYLNEMIDNIIIHSSNPYTRVHDEIKTVIKNDIKKETDIFKILKNVTTSTTFNPVSGNFLKYKLDNAFGYMDLEGSNPNPKIHQEIYEGIFTRSLYDKK